MAVDEGHEVGGVGDDVCGHVAGAVGRDAEVPEDYRVVGMGGGLVDGALDGGVEGFAALAGDDMKAFSELVEKDFLAKTVSEAELLSGKPAADVNTRIFSADEFKRIQDRVEVNWAKSNKKVFASKDGVSLALDVKNVQKLRIAIYELDAAAACREAKGEVSSDIDLDCAVPTVERFLDFAAKPAILRHRETLAFPELAEPGLYVVECSGGGVSSRAVVRKGRLRATERRDAAGHVFAALDENGKIVKGTKVWLDGTVFKADENGEVSVPFAADAKSAGRKTAIVGAGRLASAIEFNHAAETYSLDLHVVLPQEALVAGCEATALVRPMLRAGGIVSTLKLLESPTLTVTFKDVKGRETVKTYKEFELFDDAESVCRFKVPWNLSNVKFKLEGRVKRVTGGDDERPSAAWSMNVNEIANGSQIEQLFLRRVANGYVLECRGRTGERIAHRAVTLTFKHCAFRAGGRMVKPGEGFPPGRLIDKTLQCDENGEIIQGGTKLPRKGDDFGIALALGKENALVNSKPIRLQIPAFKHQKLKYHGLDGGELVRGEYFYAPVSFLAQATGSECNMSADGRNAELILRDGRMVEFAQGSIGCVIDNKIYSMDCEAVIRDGALCLPVEWFFRRLLGCFVSESRGVMYITDHYIELAAHTAALIEDILEQ